jgi:hypothetical protein
MLESTEKLMQRAGQEKLLRERRKVHVKLNVEGETILVRDQAPLHRGNIGFEEGWTFEQFVAHLNRRVFFWPGREGGPLPYGVRHFLRYAAEGPVILRIPSGLLLAANPHAAIQFSRCNSGSPRYNGGVAAVRGMSTFVSAADAVFRAAQVVELTIANAAALPEDSQVGFDPAGPWTNLLG